MGKMDSDETMSEADAVVDAAVDVVDDAAADAADEDLYLEWAELYEQTQAMEESFRALDSRVQALHESFTAEWFMEQMDRVHDTCMTDGATTMDYLERLLRLLDT